MDLILRNKNMEVAEPMREYIQTKLNRLEHHFSQIRETKVEVSKEHAKAPNYRYVVEITVSVNGIILRAEEHESDLRSAIDAAAHAIDLQAKRYKEKLHLKNRKSIKEIEGKEYTVIETVETKEPSKVVKTKRFPIQPMSVDDAMHQMELLGHDFFFFYNKQTDSYNVLYLRNDGDVGLIEPQR